MSVLEKAKPAPQAQQPPAKTIPPELMAVASRAPANVEPNSYALGLKHGHAAALAAMATKNKE